VALIRIHRTSSDNAVLNFMPAGFRSPADVVSLFASDNNMTVGDLLHRFLNYFDNPECERGEPPHTGASQWRLYVQQHPMDGSGRIAVLTVFDNSFRVLDIPTYIFKHRFLVLSMVPEHTRRVERISPGNVTREFLCDLIKIHSANTVGSWNASILNEIDKQETRHEAAIGAGIFDEAEVLNADRAHLDWLTLNFEESKLEALRYQQNDFR